MCFNKGSGVKGQENGVTVTCKNGMPQEHKGIKTIHKHWNSVFRFPFQNQLSPPKFIFMLLSEIWGTRHTFALLSFLGFASIYIMRVNLSVTIVAMAKAGSIKQETSTYFLSKRYLIWNIIPFQFCSETNIQHRKKINNSYNMIKCWFKYSENGWIVGQKD